VLEQSLSDGIVSAAGRQLEGQRYIQHTAAVNPGNSGGPLMDERGQIVGINTIKASLEGVSFAIPASRIRACFGKR
jgi:serine protease Do